MSSDTARPSIWWNCGVWVASESRRKVVPGDDDEQRRRLRLHRPDLHRRGVRAQQDRVGPLDVLGPRRREVEGVRPQPRRVRRRVVERVEVVVDGLHVGALGDVEAQADEDVLELAPGLGDQVQPSDRRRGVGGQRDVDAVAGQAGVELGRLELARARGDLGLERLARLVRGLADRAALARARGRARRAAGWAARPCARADAPAAPRAPRSSPPRRSPPHPLPGSRRCDRSSARHPTVSLLRPPRRARGGAEPSGSLRTGRRSPPSRRSATPTGSGCGRRRSAAASTSAGRPSRSAPTSSVASPGSGPVSGSPSPATSAMRSPGRSARRPLLVARCARRRSRHPRDRHREDRPHARPHRLGPVGVGAAGAQRDAGRSERERAAQHGADVAGVADAPQGDAQRARRRRPALLVDRERARARAQRRCAREQLGLDLGALEPAAGGDEPLDAAPSRRRRPPRAGPRPRPRSAPPCRARCGAPRALASFRRWLWGDWMAVMERKRAPSRRSGARRGSGVGRGSGRRRLAGALGKSAEGLGVVDGDVGEDLAVELDRRPGPDRG